MTANRWWELREWLTTPEAAEELSATTGIATSEADVLRFALDGHLKLSVNLPAGANVKCFEDDAEEYPSRWATIDGLWELPMIGGARRQVEHQYHSLCGLPSISMDACDAAMVQKDGVRCQFNVWARPESAPALPDGSVIVVRTNVLQEFIARRPKPAPEAKISSAENPVGTRERGTFYIMIAALAKGAGVDISKPTAAGETIAAMVAELGHSLASNTIARHLRNYNELISAHNDEKPRSRKNQKIGN